MDYPLSASDHLTQKALSFGIHSWNQLTPYIQNLAYGRNTNREDFSLVFTEQKGTCSSKHALLKSIADSNQIPNVDLIIGIYRMDEKNTPKIGKVLKAHRIAYIPEAHCYLSCNNQRVDYTTINADIQTIEKDILEEIKIKPAQVVQFKIEYHQQFIKNWLEETHSSFNFQDIWKVREKCIQMLSQSE